MRVQVPVTALLVLLGMLDEGLCFTASLTARTISNDRVREAGTDAHGFTIIDEKRAISVEARIHAFEKTGESINVQCFFFARHPDSRGPYLFDVQEKTVFGSDTVIFQSPDVTLRQTRSRSQTFEGYLDPFGLRIPFEGTLDNSSTARGARIHGWVVITVVDGVIEQVKSNQSDIIREFERQARESRKTKKQEAQTAVPPNVLGSKQLQEEATSAALLRDMTFVKVGGGSKKVYAGTRVRIFGRSNDEATVTRGFFDTNNDKRFCIGDSDLISIWVTAKDLTDFRIDGGSKLKTSDPAEQQMDSKAKLLQAVDFAIMRGAKKVGKTTAPAGARVDVLRNQDGKALIQYGRLDPAWVEESLLAKE